MLLAEIGARLRTQNIASSSGSGVGWYSWLGRMVDSTAIADRAVAILETGGLPQIPNVEVDQPVFQVLVRGARMNQVSTAYEEARQKIEDIKEDFHFFVGDLSGVHYNGIMAEQEPMYVGDDANQRPVFSCNFKVYRQST